MADSEIQILIKAVDNVSATLKDIEKNVDSTAKNTEKANQSLSDSFKQVQGTMLNLGQVAQGIHNIFEIQERATRNLENATDRLQNAELRLQNVQDAHRKDSVNLERAQLNLEKAQAELSETTMKYGSNSLEAKEAVVNLHEAQVNLTEAQELGSRKADDLTIATNNVERAQRAVAKVTDDANWAIVDMGMQALSVVGNLGTFITSLNAVRTASALATGVTGLGGMTAFLTGPWGIALAGAGALFGLFMMGMNEDSAKGATAVNNNLTQIPSDIYTYHHIVEVKGAGKGGVSAKYDIGLKEVTAKYGQQTGTRIYEGVQVTPIKTSYIDKGLMGGGQTGKNLSVSDIYPFDISKTNFSAMNTPSTTSTSTTISALEWEKILSNSRYLGETTKVGDAIIKPNGQIIETDPMDTIFASKSGFGGMTINVFVEGNVTSENELTDILSSKLADNLRGKILT